MFGETLDLFGGLNTTDFLNFEIQGPGDLCLWASVYQTDPTKRINPPNQGSNPTWLAPEDQFLCAYPNSSRYFRIAGELLVDMYNVDPTPLEKAEKREIEECRQERQDELLKRDLQNSGSGVNVGMSTGSSSGQSANISKSSTGQSIGIQKGSTIVGSAKGSGNPTHK